MKTESRIEYLGDRCSAMAAQSARQQHHNHHHQWPAPESGFTCQGPAVPSSTQLQHFSLLETPRGCPHQFASSTENQPDAACYHTPAPHSERHQQAAAAFEYELTNQIAHPQALALAPGRMVPRQHERNVGYPTQETSQNLVHKQKHLILANSPFQSVDPHYKPQAARYVVQQQQRQQQATRVHYDYSSPDASARSPEIGANQDQRQLYLVCGPLANMSQLNEGFACDAQQTGGNNDDALTQLRPRVSSLSVTRREPGTPSATCAAKHSAGLTRSLSFSDQLNQRPSSCDEPMATLAAGPNRCYLAPTSRGSAPEELVETGDSHLGARSAYYQDLYGARAHPATGSISSTCSSIGSPVSMVQPISPQLAPGHHARPVSSNSSSDGAEFYHRQQHSVLGGGANCQLPQKSAAQMSPHATSSGSAKAASYGSSIISASDSLSMSINLEQYISKRNERERSRVRNVNDAFDNLKNSLPLDVEKMSKRMSKVEILRTAIGYIRNLEQVLGYKHRQRQHSFKCTDSSGKARPNCNLRRLDQTCHHVNQHHHIKRHYPNRGLQQGSSDDDYFDSSPSKIIRRAGGGGGGSDEHDDYEHDEQENEYFCAGARQGRDLKMSGANEFERQSRQSADSSRELVDGNCSMEDDDRFKDY